MFINREISIFQYIQTTEFYKGLTAKQFFKYEPGKIYKLLFSKI